MNIKDILIVISRGKTLIEDHFDNSPELEERLLAANKTKAYECIWCNYKYWIK